MKLTIEKTEPVEMAYHLILEIPENLCEEQFEKTLNDLRDEFSNNQYIMKNIQSCIEQKKLRPRLIY